MRGGDRGDLRALSGDVLWWRFGNIAPAAQSTTSPSETPEERRACSISSCGTLSCTRRTASQASRGAVPRASRSSREKAERAGSIAPTNTPSNHLSAWR